MPTHTPPHVVAFNLTRRCNLNCAHCYLDARARQTAALDELGTSEICRVLDDIAALGGETMVVLTGGEPLLRKDLEAIARHGSAAGLMIVVGTNGMGLSKRRVASLAAADVRGVGISVDSLDPEQHDAFRGLRGAFARTMAGIDACRSAGLPFQIHFTVTDNTAAELDSMIAFARSSAAIALNVFFLVCTGRGRHVSNISRAGYDRTLHRLTQAAHDSEDLMIRAKCAPHFKRMAIELDPSWPITIAQGYQAGGCLAGTRYARITPEGDVTPCPYIERSAGSVRSASFADIWQAAPVLEQLRSPRLAGKCGACEYTVICGGCRARPFAKTGDLMGEDTLCTYVPTGAAVIEEWMPQPVGGLDWSAEAQARLQRVPPFVRDFVRQRVEDHARNLGCAVVTMEHLETLMRRRFGGAHPALRPSAQVQTLSEPSHDSG